MLDSSLFNSFDYVNNAQVRANVLNSTRVSRCDHRWLARITLVGNGLPRLGG